MPVTIATLLSGPATVTWQGHVLFAQDGILITPALELEAVDSDAQGVVDATVTTGPVTIKFSPAAPFADLLALYPFLDGAPGTSLFGAEDTPLVLVGGNGVRLTFAAAAILQMPDLALTVRGAAAGAVTFVAIGARSLPVTAANRLVAIDTAEFPALPTTPPQLADDYQITWGTAPWADLRAREGVTVKFAMKSRAVWSAANALLDMTLESLAVTVSFTPGTPNGLAEADVIAALQLQSGEPSGRLLSTAARTLQIAGEHLWVELPQAQLTAGPIRFDATHPRVGELMFTATRAVMNAEDPLATLSNLSEGQTI